MRLHTVLTPEWIEWGKQKSAENPRLEGFVAGEGGYHPKVLLLGEAPGDKEVKLGHPFQGPAGKELDRWLASLGLTREDIYITGVVSARPFSIGKTGRKRDRRPNNTEVKQWAPMFDYEMTYFRNLLMIPMGNASLQRLLGNQAKVGELHGQLIERPIQYFDESDQTFKWTDKPRKIFPLYHPSYSKRFKSMQTVVDEDSRHLKKLLEQMKNKDEV